ncbi:MAG: RelA/SpoT family protein [Lentimicrobiaceae bacterium]|nr:RelA/SpoT family protein [Lentimicrobiaceae bacterium]
MYQIDPEQEKREIIRRYRKLLNTWRMHTKEFRDTSMVQKAFKLALRAHKDMRRKSGEPYIYHPLEVARICAGEIGLGETSIICALLHDVVEDAGYPLEDIRDAFGEKVAQITDGLTKIKKISDSSTGTIQDENHRKILLTLSIDVRVMLIKLGDRLHNMRTLEFMAHEKQLKIASETTFLYVPLAHRLGLYAIKSELEDLAFRFTQQESYNAIYKKLKETEPERKAFIAHFISPIVKELQKRNSAFEIIFHDKSVFSIWKKMQKKEVAFEEMYDVFAIRIIIELSTDDDLNDKFVEKDECLKVYNIVTRFYNPLPNRFRDWISIPKANGYEALHTTVVSDNGQWVEVQIRTRRMHEIAEKGYAAHWKYKERSNTPSGLDQWLERISEIVQNADENALDFVETVRLNLYPEEITVFTPKGDPKILPINATTLDFAYSIHTNLGSTCIAAKVNNKLVTLKHQLTSGDKVEIISSKKEKPKEEWLDFVITARAKAKIREALREERKQRATEGKKILEEIFNQLNIEFIKSNVIRFQEFNKLSSLTDLYYKVALGEVGIKELKNSCHESDKSNSWLKYIRMPFSKQKNEDKPRNLSESMQNKLKGKNDTQVLIADFDKVIYCISDCCNPIPGDDVVGLVSDNETIDIHRTNCKIARELMSRFGNRIVKAKWRQEGEISFLTGVRITGIDKIGFVLDITRVIAEQHNLNIRSLHFSSNEGVTEGEIMLFIHNAENLNILIAQLKKIKGVSRVSRIN